MDTLVTILKDFQPAGVVIVAVALAAIVSNMTMPQIGPWVSFLAIGGVAVYVGNRVMDVDPRPAWLLPLALGGAVAAVGAVSRLLTAMTARSNNDNTVGYVFPTALAIAALWLSIALINFQATHETITQAVLP